MGGEAGRLRPDLGLTEPPVPAPRANPIAPKRRRLVPAAALAATALALAGGCATKERHLAGVRAYYEWDFPAARERFRERVADAQPDEDVLLDHLRLGQAALADGALEEAEDALLVAFDYLSTAGLNADRTTAAVWMNEGVRIWKGEPFEQALAYHSVATLFAVKGDWENARAAAANSIFRLTDFGAEAGDRTMTERAAEDDDFLDEGYDAVETDFALGYLMQGLAGSLVRAGGEAASGAQLDAAVALDPGLADVVEQVRSGTTDTILFIEFGKGPTKQRYGPDGVFTRFAPQDVGPARVRVTVDDVPRYAGRAAADVNRMSTDHRWNAFEDVRQAKSLIGSGLTWGGLAVLSSASRHDDGTKAAVGVGMLLAGLITKSNARADVRYNELSPQALFVVPLALDGAPSRVEVVVTDGRGNDHRWIHDVEPGTPGDPRAIFVRMLGGGSPSAPWMTEPAPVYTSDHDPAIAAVGGPFILGGRDVSTPSRAVLDAYRAGGAVPDDWTLGDLERLYDAEGVVLGAGRGGPDPRDHARSYRHVLEGGTGLFTPADGSAGAKRILHRTHPAWRPRSDVARSLPDR